MEFETKLVVTVRAAVEGMGTVREIKMFGGIDFMLNGNLLAAVSKRGLLARVGKDQQPAALVQPGVRPMVMRGRTMQGYVYLNPPHISRLSVRRLLQMAVHFVRALPPKVSRAKSKSPKKVPKKAVPRVAKRRAKK